MIVNANLIGENTIQIKSVVMIRVAVSVKIQSNIVCAKNILSGILVYMIVKLIGVSKVLLMIWQLHAMKI